MKNIVLFKTKIVSVTFAFISLILGLTVNPIFYAILFLSLLLMFFAFIIPVVNHANMLRLKHLQEASGGDIFKDPK